MGTRKHSLITQAQKKIKRKKKILIFFMCIKFHEIKLKHNKQILDFKKLRE